MLPDESYSPTGIILLLSLLLPISLVSLGCIHPLDTLTAEAAAHTSQNINPLLAEDTVINETVLADSFAHELLLAGGSIEGRVTLCPSGLQNETGMYCLPGFAIRAANGTIYDFAVDPGTVRLCGWKPCNSRGSNWIYFPYGRPH